jgi:hypothetical protein
MGNRHAREFMLKQDDEAAWRRMHEEPRLAIHEVQARGIGARRLQLIVLPSFEEPLAFEVRQQVDEWQLFRSQVVESWPTLRLVGYDRLEMKSATLESYFARITALSLPLKPDLRLGGGADGVTHHLALFGNFRSEWRFQWWSTSPTEWHPLVCIANEMLQEFSSKGVK